MRVGGEEAVLVDIAGEGAGKQKWTGLSLRRIHDTFSKETSGNPEGDLGKMQDASEPG